MRRLLTGLVVFGMLAWVGSALAAGSAVYYFTGRVQAFDEKMITVDNRQLYIIKNCTYERQTRRNDAYFVDKAAARNVRVGDSVMVHINGTIVDKIMIEEWKR